MPAGICSVPLSIHPATALRIDRILVASSSGFDAYSVKHRRRRQILKAAAECRRGETRRRNDLVLGYGDEIPTQAEAIAAGTTLADKPSYKSIPDLDYLQELLAIQQQGPRAIGFFGTRNMGFMHQQLIEILSYAMVITKNHIYTSGASGTNAAVIRGALRAERPELLTVILPQSLKKQPPESQELLAKVKNVMEMPHNDHLPLIEASRLCNMDILSHVQQGFAPVMALHLYIDLMSQPSRAVYIFCRMNNIDAEIHYIELMKKEHQTPEYKDVNPMGQVPAIVDKGFKLSESHAILRYLATTKPGVSNNWFPSDPLRRARIDSVLDWHHGNLRRGATGLFFAEVIAPYLGLPRDESKIAELEKTLEAAVDTIENMWLEEGGKFLCGASEMSIADLSLACEIIQLEPLKDKYASLTGSRDKLKKWMLDVEEAASPYFRDALSRLTAATTK